MKLLVMNTLTLYFSVIICHVQWTSASNLTNETHPALVLQNHLRNYESKQIADDAKLFYILNSIFATFGYLFNFLVVITFIKLLSSKKFSLPNLLLFTQAIVDLIISILLTTDAVFLNLTFHFAHSNYTNPKYRPPTMLTHVRHFFFYYTPILASTNLLITTAERFICIKYPFFHRKITRWMFLAIFCFNILISAIPAIVNLTYVDPIWIRLWAKGLTSEERYMKWIYVITTGLIQLSIVLTVYLLLFIAYIAIRKSINKRINLRQEIAMPSKNSEKYIQSERKKQLRILSILLSICTVYAITFLPYTLFLLLEKPITRTVGKNLTTKPYIRYKYIQYSLILLYNSSAILNPLITLFCKKDYKESLVYLFKVDKLRSSKNIQQEKADQGLPNTEMSQM